MSFSARAHAETAARRSNDPTGLWGGSTLGAGNALWLRPSAGYDMNTALVSGELGYTRAIVPAVDASLALALNVGFTSALSVTARGRWAAFRFRNFHLAGDLPLLYTAYTSGDPPRLTMLGAEPGVTMSTTIARKFGIFYGAALRLYHADSTYFFGPQARAGLGWSLGDFRLAFGVNLSHVLVTKTPAMTLFSADLSFAYLFGGA